MLSGGGGGVECTEMGLGYGGYSGYGCRVEKTPVLVNSDFRVGGISNNIKVFHPAEV